MGKICCNGINYNTLFLPVAPSNLESTGGSNLSVDTADGQCTISSKGDFVGQDNGPRPFFISQFKV
jgi:hypothetical protein